MIENLNVFANLIFIAFKIVLGEHLNKSSLLQFYSLYCDELFSLCVFVYFKTGLT